MFIKEFSVWSVIKENKRRRRNHIIVLIFFNISKRRKKNYSFFKVIKPLMFFEHSSFLWKMTKAFLKKQKSDNLSLFKMPVCKLPIIYACNIYETFSLEYPLIYKHVNFSIFALCTCIINNLIKAQSQIVFILK